MADEGAARMTKVQQVYKVHYQKLENYARSFIKLP